MSFPFGTCTLTLHHFSLRSCTLTLFSYEMSFQIHFSRPKGLKGITLPFEFWKMMLKINKAHMFCSVWNKRRKISIIPLSHIWVVVKYIPSVYRNSTTNELWCNLNTMLYISNFDFTCNTLKPILLTHFNFTISYWLRSLSMHMYIQKWILEISVISSLIWVSGIYDTFLL